MRSVGSQGPARFLHADTIDYDPESSLGTHVILLVLLCDGSNLLLFDICFFLSFPLGRKSSKVLIFIIYICSTYKGGQKNKAIYVLALTMSLAKFPIYGDL